MNTPANTKILSSVRRNNEAAYTIYSGGTTQVKFLDYLKNTLIPTLHVGNVLIMDNMRTHPVKEVKMLYGIAEAFSRIRPDVPGEAGGFDMPALHSASE